MTQLQELLTAALIFTQNVSKYVYIWCKFCQFTKRPCCTTAIWVSKFHLLMFHGATDNLSLLHADEVGNKGIRFPSVWMVSPLHLQFPAPPTGLISSLIGCVTHMWLHPNFRDLPLAPQQSDGVKYSVVCKHFIYIQIESKLTWKMMP